jgi:hypothetical protein
MSLPLLPYASHLTPNNIHVNPVRLNTKPRQSLYPCSHTPHTLLLTIFMLILSVLILNLGEVFTPTPIRLTPHTSPLTPRILSLSLRYHDNSITRSGDIAKTLGFKPVGQIGAPTNFVHNAGRYLRSP